MKPVLCMAAPRISSCEKKTVNKNALGSLEERVYIQLEDWEPLRGLQMQNERNMRETKATEVC